MKFVFIMLSFLFTSKMDACDCIVYDLKELDQKSYKYSNLIVIGDVVKTGENYEIEIIEILKGKYNKKLINGTIKNGKGYINSCSSVPNKKGIYIFYLNEVEDKNDFYSYSSCSASRLLDMSIYPISLATKKNKSDLIIETNNWINWLRKENYENS